MASIEDNRRRVIDGIVADAQSQGLACHGVEHVMLGEQASTVGNGFRLFFGGSFPIDTCYVLRFSGQQGEQWTFVQPFSGHYPMPGEHFLVVPRAPYAPTSSKGLSWFWRRPQLRLRVFAFMSAFILPIALGPFALLIWPFSILGVVLAYLGKRAKFFSADGGAFAKHLDGDPTSIAALRALPTEWRVGAASVTHEWRFQWTSLGGGTGLIVVPSRSGQQAGFDRAFALARAVVAATPPSSPPAFAAIEEPRYLGLAMQRSLPSSSIPPALPSHAGGHPIIDLPVR